LIIDFGYWIKQGFKKLAVNRPNNHT